MEMGGGGQPREVTVGASLVSLQFVLIKTMSAKNSYY